MDCRVSETDGPDVVRSSPVPTLCPLHQLYTSAESSSLGSKVSQLFQSFPPPSPQRPALHSSQIKPLSDFCFPNLWALIEAPTLERETSQRGMISQWQGEAEITFPGMSPLKPPDHPVIFQFPLFLPLSSRLSGLLVLFVVVTEFPTSSTDFTTCAATKWWKSFSANKCLIHDKIPQAMFLHALCTYAFVC